MMSRDNHEKENADAAASAVLLEGHSMRKTPAAISDEMVEDADAVGSLDQSSGDNNAHDDGDEKKEHSRTFRSEEEDEEEEDEESAASSEILENDTTRTTTTTRTTRTTISNVSVTDDLSISLLNPNTTLDLADAPAIALLKQIFPEESPQALRELHHHRVMMKQGNMASSSTSRTTMTHHQQHQHQHQPQSKLGQRIWNMYFETKKTKKPFICEDEDESTKRRPATTSNTSTNTNPILEEWNHPVVVLPPDFLRLPISVAVLRHRRPSTRNNDITSSSSSSSSPSSSLHYEFLSDLHQRAMEEYILVQQQSITRRRQLYYPNNDNDDADDSMTLVPFTPTSTSILWISTQQQQQPHPQHEDYFFTVAVPRQEKIGLGLTLTILSTNDHHDHYHYHHQGDEDDELVVRVHGFVSHHQHHPETNNPCTASASASASANHREEEQLLQSNNDDDDDDDDPSASSAQNRIRPGDILVGINGSTFYFLSDNDNDNDHNEDSYYNLSSSSAASRMMQPVVRAIQASPNPVVLHLVRRSGGVGRGAGGADQSRTMRMMEHHHGVVEQKQKRNQSSLLDHSNDEEDDVDVNYYYGEDDGDNNNNNNNNNRMMILDPHHDGESIATASTMTTFTTTTTTSSFSPNIRSHIFGDRRNHHHDHHRPMIPQQQNTTTTTTTTRNHTKNNIHPFASALAKRGLIRGVVDEQRITKRLHQFMIRAQQWETFSSLRIDATTHELLPRRNNTGTLESAAATMLPGAPSTPLQVSHEDDDDDDDDDGWKEDPYSHHPLNKEPYRHRSLLRSYPAEASSRYSFSAFSTPNNKVHHHHHHHHSWNEIFLPLYNIRKALCARIVNTFVETTTTNNKHSEGIAGTNEQQSGSTTSNIAYTIWVYDVETTKEWYAPIRYWQDFEDLRQACIALAPKEMGIRDWEFPKKAPTGNHHPLPNGLSSLFFWLGNGGNSSSSSNATTGSNNSGGGSGGGEHYSHQLEHFLRNLCSLIYTCDSLSPEVAEMAIHVQSFLGVEAGLSDATDWGDDITLNTNEKDIEIHGGSPSFLDHDPNGSNTSLANEKAQVRQELKMSLQRYTYRIFLLNVMKAIVNDFVDTTRARGPKLQDIESLEFQATLKSRAKNDLERIQSFLDQMVDLILDGCEAEMRQIAQQEYYWVLHASLFEDTTTSGAWERLVREAIREQVEIEVYVPLRSVVSRLLVNGWRHEDMEVQFKIKELRKRPQGLFRIPSDKMSPTHWQSVATILKKGVGMSTLPCVKLRAIVDASREIARLYEQEHPRSGGIPLGADDLLPIFIFCVVRADMERPCALCVLLQTLCDRLNRIGEIGYFLASFEAAIAHITELDLTEDSNNDGGGNENDDEDAISFLSEGMTEVSLGE